MVGTNYLMLQVIVKKLDIPEEDIPKPLIDMELED